MVCIIFIFSIILFLNSTYFFAICTGFFQKGISFSGSVLPPWTLSRNNTEKSIHLAALVGCPTTTTRDAVKCLRRRPGRQILKAVEFFQVNLKIFQVLKKKKKLLKLYFTFNFFFSLGGIVRLRHSDPSWNPLHQMLFSAKNLFSF